MPPDRPAPARIAPAGVTSARLAPTRVTSAQVAKLAGVSQSAVSRVYTPGASVSQKTAEKVIAAARALGYRPNVLARAMITGKSRIIGLVVAYLENQFYPVAIERLSRALQAQGYHLLIFMADNDLARTAEVVEELLDYQVDGIVAASVSLGTDLVARCEGAGIPIVLFNRGQEGLLYRGTPLESTGEVTSDNRAGGRAVARFLLASGHRRIAHVSGWQGSTTGRDRLRGLEEGLAEGGTGPVAVIDGLYRRDAAAAAARALMERPDPPDAIFVGNDHMAFGVLDELRHRMGLRVPGDVSVVGYDDVPIAAWEAYDLTTVRQDVRRMVAATVAALTARIEGTGNVGRTEIPGPLIVRGSARTDLPRTPPTEDHP